MNFMPSSSFDENSQFRYPKLLGTIPRELRTNSRERKNIPEPPSVKEDVRILFGAYQANNIKIDVEEYSNSTTEAMNGQVLPAYSATMRIEFSRQTSLELRQDDNTSRDFVVQPLSPQEEQDLIKSLTPTL
ncbi:hypothetical protein ACTXT7_001069 [Hymenolepis weldensis]